MRIVFAGNLGQFQGLDKIVDAARRFSEKPKNIELTLIGEGKALNNLRLMAKNSDNITFLPHMPFGDVKTVSADADYGLVSLEAGIYRFAYPSKTLTYLGMSVPLAVVVEPESNLAKAIINKNMGYCCLLYTSDAADEG